MSDSDDGDNECPLCTEELDLTDQAAELCQCGYKICLWCWNQIMENAAKDNSEGRCPACRTVYNPEKINMAEIDQELLAESKKKKREKKSEKRAAAENYANAYGTSPGGRHMGSVGPMRSGSGSFGYGGVGPQGGLGPNSNANVDRKLLQNVRVIQRNLVYVIGLSMNICREDVLRRTEYFGRFGKILKISANRSVASGGSGAQGIQTGSAYVTFVRAEDAWKCIQAIDGAVWDGRQVRACYGTTKYCNAFLKYQTCTNPECLYLHDVGDEADSYTKEELASGHVGAKAAMGIRMPTQASGPQIGGPGMNSGMQPGMHAGYSDQMNAMAGRQGQAWGANASNGGPPSNANAFPSLVPTGSGQAPSTFAGATSSGMTQSGGHAWASNAGAGWHGGSEQGAPIPVGPPIGLQPIGAPIPQAPPGTPPPPHILLCRDPHAKTLMALDALEQAAISQAGGSKDGGMPGFGLPTSGGLGLLALVRQAIEQEEALRRRKNAEIATQGAAVGRAVATSNGTGYPPNGATGVGGVAASPRLMSRFQFAEAAMASGVPVSSVEESARMLNTLGISDNGGASGVTNGEFPAGSGPMTGFSGSGWLLGATDGPPMEFDRSMGSGSNIGSMPSQGGMMPGVYGAIGGGHSAFAGTAQIPFSTGVPASLISGQTHPSSIAQSPASTSTVGAPSATASSARGKRSGRGRRMDDASSR